MNWALLTIIPECDVVAGMNPTLLMDHTTGAHLFNVKFGAPHMQTEDDATEGVCQKTTCMRQRLVGTEQEWLSTGLAYVARQRMTMLNHTCM